METVQKYLFEAGSNSSLPLPSITIGTVVDTNDPQQMGRCRVFCPTLGDVASMEYTNLPWAIYVSPFGGNNYVMTRGPGVQQSEGSIAYGIWAVPKVGAQVMVFCLDGNPEQRAYFGAVFDHMTPHTMPHGRWMYDDHPTLQKTNDTVPYGPYTSSEKLIQPLSTNIQQAFSARQGVKYEWRNRAADYSVAGLSVDQLDATYSTAPDDKDIKYDDWTSTQGYQVSRSDPNLPSYLTGKNYDPQTYTWTTPGFHAFSMDDRQENCRIRLRTTSGHQIIMDDTNERIYIATAQGNNWIEMDQAGNIDIYTTNKVNVRAEKEINFTSDDTIRMYAKKGIHMVSDDEIRMQAKQDVHMKFEQNLRMRVSASTYMQTDQNVDVKAGQTITHEAGQNINAKAGQSVYVEAGTDINLRAGGSGFFQVGATLNLKSAENTLMTGKQIHFNGPPASSASSAQAAQDPSEQPAKWTDRVPGHEPWARVMTKNDFTHEPEFPYDSKEVNRNERGNQISRGLFWRR